MFEPVLIETREEYNICVERGFEPLLDPLFPLEISLRVEIQREIFGHTVFGRGNIPQANQRFYKWVWNHKRHFCEECKHELYNYSATFVSHILSRGAHPEKSTDPRNTNILCGNCHNIYEDSSKRKTMNIYPGTLLIIEILTEEYNSLKTLKWNQ